MASLSSRPGHYERCASKKKYSFLCHEGSFMNGLQRPDNPYAPPNSEYILTRQTTPLLIVFTLLLGWVAVATVIGYALLGIIANGYEMTVEFSEWRLREEILLGVLFAFGAFLCFLMRRAHQSRSAYAASVSGFYRLQPLRILSGRIFPSRIWLFRICFLK